MKKTSFTEEQAIGVLRQAAQGEQTIGEFCRPPGVSEQPFYRYRGRQKFGGRRMEQANLALYPPL